MSFYIILFIIFFIFVAQDKKLNLENKNGSRSHGKSVQYLIIFYILLFIGATRAKTVGSDVIYYCYVFDHVTFETINPIYFDFEPGFLFSMAVFKKLLIDKAIFFIYFIFLLYFYFNNKFLRKYTIKPSLALFLIYGLSYYFFALNGMRQSLCHSLILMYIPLIGSTTVTKTKYVYFCLLTIVTALLIQKSQIILVLAILPFYFDRFITRKILAICVVSSLFIGIVLISKVSDFLGSLASSVSDQRYQNYLLDTNSIGDASNITLIAHSLYSLLLIYFYKNKGTNKNGSLTDKFCAVGVAGVVVLNIFSPILWIFQRFADGLFFFRIIPMTNYFYTIKDRKERRIFQLITILYVIMRFYGRLQRDSAVGSGDVIPYVNDLFNITM